MIYDEYSQSLYEKLLIKALADRKQEVLDKLGSGDGIKDFPSYAKWTGYVKALVEVHQMMATVNETIRKMK
jgi:hypothetical protein